jgi:hypothetical protein
MAMTWEGSDGRSKPNWKLDGKQIIVKNIGVFDGSIPTTFREETIYHFDSEEKALEYYYKKR